MNYLSDKNQRWKLNGDKLENKEGLWTKDDLWNFKSKNNTFFFYIENTSKTKVLEATSDGKVIQKDKVEGKAHQLWKKGKSDDDDYVTLIHSGMPKLIITAISASDMEIKGNIKLIISLLK